MSKRLLIALLIGVFLVSAGLGGFAADKVQITVWCQAFDPHVNGFDNQIWAIGIPDPPGDAGLVVNLDALKEAGLWLPQSIHFLRSRIPRYPISRRRPSKNASRYWPDGS